MKGVIIAAPNSGAGKTTLTLGIIRALTQRGLRVATGKSGPDYIDPRYHSLAGAGTCVNLDVWAMNRAQILSLSGQFTGDFTIIEGAMGLYDGAQVPDNPLGKGSTADLAATLDLPVILVLDVARQGQTAVAIAQGLANMRSDIKIAAVILNQVGSAKHGHMIRRAMQTINMPVLGVIPRQQSIAMPSRHLGLVQAEEHKDIGGFINMAADTATEYLDLDALLALGQSIKSGVQVDILPPLAQHIAVARDQAFAFVYPHLLSDWQNFGAEISFFSPLNDEAPKTDADAIYLPGGYPELHAGRLAGNSNFIAGMQKAAQNERLIYGECGGYMTLGQGLIDAEGYHHEMLNLLPLVTSFENPKLHLGYRHLSPIGNLPWKAPLMAHEFHYATITQEEDTERLFHACDSMQEPLPDMGLRKGTVMGSFAHVIAMGKL